ncbi:hypothetical protein [Streptomyces turgidiscabies]|uniref:hypothetical protein n=1 Tax=Streptomyces turgidiscabies TaxID=85558 RepID=UPI0038F7D7BB
MANFDDIRTQFPVYQILFDGVGENSPLTVGFNAGASSGGPSSIDSQVQGFADAVATAWGVAVASVTRYDVTGSPV